MAYGSSQPPIQVPRSQLGHLKDQFLRRGFTFTASQLRFIDLFFAGSNVCLTGAAGTGKSFVVKALLDFLVDSGVSVGRTSTTGVSAFLIGGQTLHSFAGLGLADEHLESLIEKVKKNTKAKARMRAMTVLLIDEVSMAKGDLIDKLDGVLKWVRGSRAPFGGVQLLAVGDYLQLLPVFKGDEYQELSFQCRSWREAKIAVVVLKESVRHQGDNTLLRVLNDVRVGNRESLHLLEPRVGAAFPDSDIEPVRIFCRNADVAAYNAERLAKLPGQVKTYLAKDTGLPYHTDAFNRNCPAPERLDIKVGAQASLLVNMDVEQGLVNGSVGVVKAFGPGGVSVKFASGLVLVDHEEWSIKEQEVDRSNVIRYRVVATRSQIPLKVCYAITTHRAQGATIDRAVIDMREAFSAGMVYTALSRVRNLESLSIVGGIPHEVIRVNPECSAFYRDHSTD